MSVSSMDDRDKRLIAALQYSGRISAERAGSVLGLDPRMVQRRWKQLMADGIVHVALAPPRPAPAGVMFARISVLRGKIDQITEALAAREDIPFVDVSASGDELSVVLLGSTDSRNRLVFRQLPATSAVTSVDAQTILHVFADADDWRLDALTPGEIGQLTDGAARVPAGRSGAAASATPTDPSDIAILERLAADARATAAAVSASIGLPESTVRRRIAALERRGMLRTRVVVDPRRLGLPIDANLWLQVPPGRLDEVGRALAAHPAVHGAFATTGVSSLHVAVWLRDLEHLYEIITNDVGALGVTAVDTMLVGRAVKRPA